MRVSIVASLVFAVLAGACAGETTQEEEMAETTEPAEAPMEETTPATEGPDTTAQAVYDHLQEANYDEWALWPDKGELYEGTEPHGMLLTTYVNDLAEDALTNGAAEMPDGAIVVKDNYSPDSTLMAHTVMYKVDGYDANHSDWFWAKYGADGEVQASGRVDSCAECHAQASDQDDYLVTKMQQRTAGAGGS
ncbi:MAG: cytochrome P460 family protein [Gemmatimonadota bacterium]|nr:cytochrome P460 family protein [Gemmatimonadota bacterium]